MENKYAVIYQIIISVVLITGSVLIIVYRKKFFELQKRYFSKQNNVFGRKVLENLEKKPQEYNTFLTVAVGLFIIILSVIELFKLF